MAARFWRYLIVGEMLCALLLTALVASAFSPPPWVISITAVAALLAVSCLMVSGSFVAIRLTNQVEESVPELLRAFFRESVAFARAAFAMSIESCRRRKRGDTSKPSRGKTPVLLIHGIVCNRAIWRPLVRELHAHGFGPIRAVNLEPLFADIDSHARRVARELRKLREECGGTRVAIVAHSMGGLIARAVLRDMGPDDISQIITLASPHHGSALARLLPLSPLRQMRPDSTWLATLNAAQEGHLSVPVTTIYSANDNLISPPRSAVLEGARSHELRGVGHLSLLSARESIDRVLLALTGIEARDCA